MCSHKTITLSLDRYNESQLPKPLLRLLGFNASIHNKLTDNLITTTAPTMVRKK